MEKHFNHTPVLLNQCIEGLNIKSNGVYVDGTFGGGGHSYQIISKLKNGRLIAIDKDADAILLNKTKFNSFKNFELVKSDFKDIKTILSNLKIEKVDGILLDLGVSSYQIDSLERGFSYRFNSPLDMRMDQENELSAKVVVNEYSQNDLLDILYNYGEEKNAKKIVLKIIEQRKIKPIETTFELRDLVESCFPTNRNGLIMNCQRTFQAIRIEVNGELKNLETAIRNMINCLNKNGRLCVITFHSLEDRIVKKVFNECATNCICDKSIPVCVCNHKATIKLINKKPIVANEVELKENKRSSSAKLRVIEKI